MVIASHIPGRLRVRDRRFLADDYREEVLLGLAALDSTIVCESNPRCGSLLLHYDPARLAPERLAGWLAARFGAAATEPSPTAPGHGAPLAADRLRRVAGRNTNRVAKYGLLASIAVMLLALGRSTRLHAAAGGLNMAFLALHLLHHRTKLLK